VPLALQVLKVKLVQQVLQLQVQLVPLAQWAQLELLVLKALLVLRE
jgi:hypothetical protein